MGHYPLSTNLEISQESQPNTTKQVANSFGVLGCPSISCTLVPGTLEQDVEANIHPAPTSLYSHSYTVVLPTPVKYEEFIVQFYFTYRRVLLLRRVVGDRPPDAARRKCGPQQPCVAVCFVVLLLCCVCVICYHYVALFSLVCRVLLPCFAGCVRVFLCGVGFVCLCFVLWEAIRPT